MNNQFLKTELKLALILSTAYFAGLRLVNYLGYREITFSWEHVLGFVLVYPIISYLNRRHLHII
jgi:hypothetical protein